MRILIFLLLTIPQQSISQNRDLDFGEVKGKNVSACADTARKAICKSKNQLEIWLTGASGLSGTYTTVTLSYNGIHWTGSRHEGDWIHNRVQILSLSPTNNFDSVITALIQNKVFILPDQKDLKVNGSVDDGIEYMLSFKAGTRFRSYEFNNPGIYQLYNKEMKEFENYNAIVEMLFNTLKVE